MGLREVSSRDGLDRSADADAREHPPPPDVALAPGSALASAIGNAAFAQMVATGQMVARGRDKRQTRSHRDEPYRRRDDDEPYAFRHNRRQEDEGPVALRPGTRGYERQQQAGPRGEAAAPPGPEDGDNRVPRDNGVFYSGVRSEVRWDDYEAHLDALGDPQPDPAHPARSLYLCEDGQRRPRKMERFRTEDYVDIDHEKDFHNWILMKGRKAMGVLPDGHTYMGITLEEASRQYNDRRNLRLMGKKKNRARGGPKNIDRVVDMHHDPSTCPHCRQQGPPGPRDPDSEGGGGSRGLGAANRMDVQVEVS